MDNVDAWHFGIFAFSHQRGISLLSTLESHCYSHLFFLSFPLKSCANFYNNENSFPFHSSGFIRLRFSPQVRYLSAENTCHDLWSIHNGNACAIGAKKAWAVCCTWTISILKWNEKIESFEYTTSWIWYQILYGSQSNRENMQDFLPRS